MKQLFNLPQYKTVNYRINAQTGYFTKTEIQPDKMSAMALPNELMISPIEIGQIKLLHIRDPYKNGRHKLFTEVLKTHFQNWLVGCEFEFRKKQVRSSTILCHLSVDHTRLTLYYFSGFKIESMITRSQFAHSAIPHLLKLQLN